MKLSPKECIDRAIAAFMDFASYADLATQHGHKPVTAKMYSNHEASFEQGEQEHALDTITAGVEAKKSAKSFAEQFLDQLASKGAIRDPGPPPKMIAMSAQVLAKVKKQSGGIFDYDDEPVRPAQAMLDKVEVDRKLAEKKRLTPGWPMPPSSDWLTGDRVVNGTLGKGTLVEEAKVGYVWLVKFDKFPKNWERVHIDNMRPDVVIKGSTVRIRPGSPLGSGSDGIRAVVVDVTNDDKTGDAQFVVQFSTGAKAGLSPMYLAVVSG